MSHKALRQLAMCAAVVVSAGLPMPGAAGAADTSPKRPKTVVWDGDHLASLRAGEAKINQRYSNDLKRLRKNAEISRKRGPYSVINKNEVAPSGDKHDYLSYARYWWPDPDKGDGMPYIRHDGKTNKDLLNKGDRETI